MNRQGFQLIGRQLIAFVIDIGFLLSWILLAHLVILFGLIRYTPVFDALIFTFIFLYFVYWECYNEGQTPGKIITKIKTVNSTRSPLTLYESTLRVSILFLTPITFDWFVRLIYVVCGSRLPRIIDSSFILLSAVAAIPFTIVVTLLIGKRSYGLHDGFSRTEVVLVNSHSDTIPATDWKLCQKRTGAIFIVLTSILAILGNWVSTPKVKNYMDILGISAGYIKSNHPFNEWSKFAVTQEDLIKAFENYREYIDSNNNISFCLVSSGFIKFKESPSNLPESLQNGDMESPIVIYYTIPLTKRGFSSIEAQTLIAGVVARRVGNFAPIIIEFQARCESVFLGMDYRRRVVVLLINGEYRILQPDFSIWFCPYLKTPGQSTPIPGV